MVAFFGVFSVLGIGVVCPEGDGAPLPLLLLLLLDWCWQQDRDADRGRRIHGKSSGGGALSKSVR
jgi:hypothetical protein